MVSIYLIRRKHRHKQQFGRQKKTVKQSAKTAENTATVNIVIELTVEKRRNGSLVSTALWNSEIINRPTKHYCAYNRQYKCQCKRLFSSGDTTGSEADGGAQTVVVLISGSRAEKKRKREKYWNF